MFCLDISEILVGAVFEDVWVEVGKYLGVWVGANEEVSMILPIFMW